MSVNTYEPRRGITLSVSASALFALMSAYTLLLAPLGGLDIFAWRVIWTAPGALALVILRSRAPQLVELVVRAFKEPRVALMLAGKGDLLPVSAFPVDGV